MSEMCEAKRKVISQGSKLKMLNNVNIKQFLPDDVINFKQLVIKCTKLDVKQIIF